MRVLRIDERSAYHRLIGVGGIGTGIFFALDGPQTLGRNESRPGRLLDVRDYCKLHIVIHYIAKLLGAQVSGLPFHVAALGLVGNDAPGKQVLREMAETGIDTKLVEVSAEYPTLFSVCFQYPDGAGGNITTNNSAAAHLSAADVEKASQFLKAGGADVIALAVPEVPLHVRRHFLSLATAARAFRAASFVSSEVREAMELGIFQMLDLVSLNEAEAAELVGTSLSAIGPAEFVRRCQQFLRDSYPGLRLIVTAGKNGAYGMTKEMWNHAPAAEIAVASTAGAGDATLGGVIAGLAAGLPFLEETREGADSRVRTALEFGALLGSHKCLSPHTIDPSACVDSLRNFAESRGRPFAPELQRLVTECEGS